MSDDQAHRTLQVAGATRRRAVRALRRAQDLLAPDAAPATTAELVKWTGLSKQKILRDIKAGELTPTMEVKQRSKALIPAPEAARYLRQLGVLADQDQAN